MLFSETEDALQAESEIVPVWPSVVVARALAKLTEPKSVSSSGSQLAKLASHADESSSIHAALDVSVLAIDRVLGDRLPRASCSV